MKNKTTKEKLTNIIDESIMNEINTINIDDIQVESDDEYIDDISGLISDISGYVSLLDETLRDAIKNCSDDELKTTFNGILQSVQKINDIIDNELM